MLEWWHALENAILGATGSPWALVILLFLAIGDGAIPPLPSETFLSALSASAASRDAFRIIPIVLIGATGALSGDMLMYTIGRLVPIPSGSKRERLVHSVTARMERSWTLVLGMARFIPVIRVAIFLAAGVKHIDWRRVILIDSASAFIWACWFAFAGYTGGVLLKGHPLLGILIGMALGSLAGILMGLLAQRIIDKQESETTK